MSRFPINLTKTALTIAVTTAMLGHVQAQDESSSVGIEEVIVTAQRKAESLQDAAIPINAATGDQLERLGVGNAEGLTKVAPALSVLSGGGANTAYFVRGVGNFTNNGYTNPAIAFNIDGVYIGRPSSTISSFLDVNRVEVLKGPQGTLYGRNSTGGAINVISNAPVIGENSGTFKLGFGDYGAFDVTGIANFASSENSALRLAATLSQRDGYFDDGTGDADDKAVRVQYYSEPTENFNYKVSVDHSTQTGNGAGVRINGNYAFQPFSSELPVNNWRFQPVPDTVVNSDYTGLHSQQVLDYISNNLRGAPGFTPTEGYAYPSRNDTYTGINAELNWDLGWSELTVIPAHRVSELDNQFNGPPFKAAINQDKADQTSLEARLSGSSGSVDYILGAYYFDENVGGVNSFNQFNTVGSNIFDSNVESTALFARGTFNVSDSTRLVGGIRFTDESRDIKASTFASAIVCLEETVGRPPNCSHVPSFPVAPTLAGSISLLDPNLFPTLGNNLPLDANGNPVPGARPYGPLNIFAPAGQFGPGAIMAITPSSVDKNASEDEVTYRVAFERDITPENLFYASFETGFRAGGFNLAFGRETYKPEFIEAFTIGSKNRFMDDRLQLNAEIFSWDYQDQQLAALGLDARGNNAFYSRNVGDSSIQGAEIDLQFAASENTLLRGSLQYLDATYDNYSFIQVDLSDAGIDPPNFLTPVTTCDYTLGIFSGDDLIAYDPALDVVGARRGFTVDCSGNDALNAPDITATLGIQQTFNLNNYQLVASLDGRYRGERELGFNYVPGGRVGSDFKTDLAMSLIPNNGNWSLDAYVLNLTDEAVASTYQLGAANISGSAMEAPRTYGVRFSYDY